ncbi:AAA family ATPase [Hansschlegelia beijingensis]
MTSSESKRQPSAAAIERARMWLLRQQSIIAGSLPTVSELLHGHLPLGGDWAKDCEMWCRSTLAHDELTDGKVRAALETLGASFKIGPVRAAIAAVVDCDDDGFDEMHDAEDRLRLYAAALGEDDGPWVGWRLRMASTRELRATAATVIGMVLTRQALGLRMVRGEVVSPATWMTAGIDAMRSIVAELDEEQAARDLVSKRWTGGEVGHGDLASAEEYDFIARVEEDRAELAPAALLDLRREKPPAAVQVIPPAPASVTGARSAWKPFEDIAGKRLRLVERGDPAAHLIALCLAFPHCRAEIATILRDLAASEIAKLRPTLLVGSPGSGKTSLARSIADAIGLSSTIYSCGGQADSSMMGTSAQWHSARPSVPLDLIRTSRQANPLVVLDELDKCASDGRNGSLQDALLAFLEPSTARRHRDLALEVEVDLSHVNWVATANKVRDVPPPLRDRFRVIQIPDPDWSHVGDLSRRILNDLAIERGLDRRWLEDLAQDELTIIRKAWPGGSLRRLRRAIEVLVDGRDHLMGRA